MTPDEKVAYYQDKARVVATEFWQLKTKYERVCRKAGAHKKSIRSLQKALELAYARNKILALELRHAHAQVSELMKPNYVEEHYSIRQ